MGERDNRELTRDMEETAGEAAVPARDNRRLPWWVVLIDVVLVLAIAGTVAYLLVGLNRHLHGGTNRPPAGIADNAIPRGEA
jgi:hypothetical protein